MPETMPETNSSDAVTSQAAAIKRLPVATDSPAPQISVRSKECVEAEGLDARPFVNGEFLLVGAGLCGGSAYALMRDLFAELLGLYGIETGDAIYTKME